jgi:hypothetical protein
MSLDMRSQLLASHSVDQIAAEQRMRRLEIALLIGAGLAVAVFSVASVLINLS